MVGLAFDTFSGPFEIFSKRPAFHPIESFVRADTASGLIGGEEELHEKREDGRCLSIRELKL